jgi:hypothetical protein
MKAEVGKETEARSKDPKTITVTVNERSVTFSEHKVTGLELKRVAIKQGVAIQEDFVLFEVKGDAPLKQIGDCDTVTLHKGQVFRATAPDDNS